VQRESAYDWLRKSAYYLNGKKRHGFLDKPITELEAFEMFKTIADKFADKVSKLVTTPVDQNQFNALVSLAYNIGPANFQKSTLLKKVNFNHNDPSIRAEFLKWNKAGGQVLKGLTIRRTAEADLYFG
jgi:lysozyme